jgi:hypothetical protein
MSQLSIRISYTIERKNWKHYGVRAAAPIGPQVLIGPFVSRGEAQAWIEGSDKQDSCDGLDSHSCLQ